MQISIAVSLIDTEQKYVVKMRGAALPLFHFLHTIKYIEVLNAERDYLSKYYSLKFLRIRYSRNEVRQ